MKSMHFVPKIFVCLPLDILSKFPKTFSCDRITFFMEKPSFLFPLTYRDFAHQFLLSLPGETVSSE